MMRKCQKCCWQKREMKRVNTSLTLATVSLPMYSILTACLITLYLVRIGIYNTVDCYAHK